MIKFLFLLLFLPISLGAQELTCDNTNIQDAYNLAVNTMNINVRRGILAAGGDYGGEWVRDIAINSWNGASLLRPKVAEKSLWSVTKNRDTIGHQYWDRMIWVIAALHHYDITGDKVFLKQAYECARNSIQQLEEQAFDKNYGLFTGPSVFNDGIAGYPKPIDNDNIHSTYILDYPNAKSIKCLSTNCVYYEAYISLIKMEKLLNIDKDLSELFKEKAGRLKERILKYFYNENENSLYYLIEGNGKVDKYQEGLGISFAIMFGIVNKLQAYKILQKVQVSNFGITSIYPAFPRFSKDKPGRHNNLIWPMVNGFFAQASIIAEDKKSYDKELEGLTHLALDEDKGDYQFREIYNPDTGKPYGGWQKGSLTQSCRLQTWSATAYINMVDFGMIGLRFKKEGIVFSPYLPPTIHLLSLKNIHYRNAILNIIIKGNGETIKSFILNGEKQKDAAINANIHGENNIIIELI